MESVVREIREKIGASSKELAETIGYSLASISQFENAGRKIPREAAEKIAEIVGVAGGYIKPDTIQAVQWHRYLTNRLPEVKDEQKNPVEKAEVLQNMFRTLEKIEQLDVSEPLKEAAQEKKQDVLKALNHLEAWQDKEKLYAESDQLIDAAEEAKSNIAG